ncbi:MAG: hypothetical protein RB292_02410 [Patescibacteria group bacterium]|jgi:hypothetical protein|nr:hypothetical protein [Patescibacteria group bacterium]
MDKITLEFIEQNKKFWPARQNFNGSFLLDLTLADIEYVNVRLVTARAFMDLYQAEPIVLISTSKNQKLIELIKSYGINKLIYLDSIKLNYWTKLLYFVLAILNWLPRKTRASLLKLKFRGNRIGNFVYDTCINSTGWGTVNPWNTRYIKFLYYAYCLYLRYERIFKQCHPKFYFGVEQAYISGGIPSAAAIANQLGVFYAKLGPNRIVYKSYKTIADLDIYPAHPSKDDFVYIMEQQKSQALEWANKYLGNLFSGNVNPADWNAINAFGKAKLLDQELYNKLFKSGYKYRVFIFPHVTVDAPHGYVNGIFNDYEEWLVETLKIASRRQDVLWILKPHPSEKAYHVEKKVSDIYHRQFAQYKNIILYPENTSTANLVNEIDAIVTVRGTAIGEYSSMGIPVITAGQNMFEHGNFTILPKDRQDYERVLMATEFQKLSAEKIDCARISLYLYLQFNSTPMPLFSDIIFDTSKPAGDQIYSHLLNKLRETKVEDLWSQEFKNYLNNKFYDGWNQKDNPAAD